MLARKGYSPGLAYRVVREVLESTGLDHDARLETAHDAESFPIPDDCCTMEEIDIGSD